MISPDVQEPVGAGADALEQPAASAPEPQEPGAAQPFLACRDPTAPGSFNLINLTAIIPSQSNAREFAQDCNAREHAHFV